MSICQNDIAKKIVDKKADYVQSSLRDDVEVLVAEKANGFKDTKISLHETVDGDHGRIETRTYTAIRDVGWLVESTREIVAKIERETRFYLRSPAWLAAN